MMQRGSHFRKVLTVLTVTYLLHVNAATDNEAVINEINKLEDMVKTIQTPPELIDAVLKQVENHCQKNRSFDQSYLTNVSHCIEKYFNVSQVANDMRAAVPEGKMDTVFRDMCIKWPKVKECMSEFFVVVDDCWQKGDKVKKFIDEVVRFYCGDDNSGEKIAIFFAEGGLECLQTHGDEVKKCVESKQDLELNQDTLTNLDLNELANKPINVQQKTDQICSSIEQLHECASLGLRKCKDPTPENLMTSMLMQVGKALECKVTEFKMRQTAATTGSGQEAIVAIPLLVVTGVMSMFAIKFLEQTVVPIYFIRYYNLEADISQK